MKVTQKMKRKKMPRLSKKFEKDILKALETIKADLETKHKGDEGKGDLKTDNKVDEADNREDDGEETENKEYDRIQTDNHDAKENPETYNKQDEKDKEPGGKETDTHEGNEDPKTDKEDETEKKRRDGKETKTREHDRIEKDNLEIYNQDTDKETDKHEGKYPETDKEDETDDKEYNGIETDSSEGKQDDKEHDGKDTDNHDRKETHNKGHDGIEMDNHDRKEDPEKEEKEYETDDKEHDRKASDSKEHDGIESDNHNEKYPETCNRQDETDQVDEMDKDHDGREIDNHEGKEDSETEDKEEETDSKEHDEIESYNHTGKDPETCNRQDETDKVDETDKEHDGKEMDNHNGKYPEACNGQDESGNEHDGKEDPETDKENETDDKEHDGIETDNHEGKEDPETEEKEDETDSKEHDEIETDNHNGKDPETCNRQDETGNVDETDKEHNGKEIENKEHDRIDMDNLDGKEDPETYNNQKETDMFGKEYLEIYNKQDGRIKDNIFNSCSSSKTDADPLAEVIRWIEDDVKDLEEADGTEFPETDSKEDGRIEDIIFNSCSSSETDEEPLSPLVPLINQSTCRTNNNGIDLMKDIENEQITMPGIRRSNISTSKKYKKSDRCYNKKSCCLFCSMLFSNISKHYSSRHKDEPKVAKILALKENHEEKTAKLNWELLRNEGNHQHNQKVVKEKTGELLVVRRKIEPYFSSEDYTPCPQCKGWYLQSALYTHCNYRCCVGKTKMRTSTIMVKSLEHRTELQDQDLLNHVFMTMWKDEVTHVAKKDNIIRRVGEFYYLKHSRNKLRNRNFAAKHMRMAASLLLKVRELDKSNFDLEYYLKPEKFMLIQEAALKLAGCNDMNYTELKHPSTAKNIGYEIKKWIDIKEEMAIVQKDKTKISECKYFLKLYQRRWTLISTSAVKQLEEKNYNKRNNLPSALDVKTLTNSIKKKLAEINYASTKTQYKTVVEYSQARLILFNKRRPGELEALTINSYRDRKNNNTVLEDVVIGTLSKLEKKLLDTHEVITVRGKRAHAVPIIVPPDCFAALEFLADATIRRSNGIKDSNRYLFANTGDEVHRAVASLKTVVSSCNAILDVNSIKATSLRKYMATNCQLLDLNDTELEWVVRHLGHSKLTHMNNYRLSSSTIERTKIAKLLIVMENETLLKKAQGVNLSDKQLDDLVLNKSNDSDEESDEHIEDSEPINEDLLLNESNDIDEESDEHSEGSEPINEGVQSKRIESDTESESEIPSKKRVQSKRIESDTESESESEIPSKKRVQAKRSRSDSESESDIPSKKRCRYNNKWTEHDVHALLEEFGDLISRGIYPSFAQIRLFKVKYPIMKKRTDAQIKAKLVHIMKK